MLTTGIRLEKPARFSSDLPGGNSMSHKRFRAALTLALPCAVLIALSVATGTPSVHAIAVTSGRYCYNWDFLNNTPQDTNDLHLSLAGVSQVGSWYTGVLNPFGLPDASSGYDATTDAYRANFSGGVVLQGETVHIGFCSDKPELRVSNALWTIDAASVAPAPLVADVSFTQVNPTQIQVELRNPQSSPLILLSFNVLDAFDGLPLDDLNDQVAAQLASVGEPLLYPEILPPGGSKSFDVLLQGTEAGMQALAAQTGAIDPGHALVVEAVMAAEDDEGNTLRLFAQMLPPSKQHLPLIRR
jgi:hypothetical protein